MDYSLKIFTSSSLIALVLLCLFSTNSFALSKLGHNLVCQLSYQNLSINKQHKIDDLLKEMPIHEKQAINKYNYLAENTKISFASACTWADAIKKESRYDKFKPWHYINLPRDAQSVQINACTENCLPQAIIIHHQQLKTTKDSWEKLQALLFLGHWLGDIHQPLHVSFGDDYGGNKIKIKSLDGKCTNLHWLWDSCLISRRELTREQWLKLLDKEWQKTQLPLPVHIEQVWHWADESFQLVRTKTLGYCIMGGKRCDAPEKELALPKNYQSQYTIVLQKRMVLAAKRLTQLLMQTL